MTTSMTTESYCIRPVEAADVEALRRLFFRLSPRTVYLRFFQPVHEPSDRTLHHFAEVDHQIRDALAAVAAGEIIGVARYDRQRADPTRAEVAVVVEDAWQSRGVGSRLIRDLAVEAKRRGVETFTASVLAENHRMLSIMHRLAPATHGRMDHGAWELDIPLDAVGVPAATARAHS